MPMALTTHTNDALAVAGEMEGLLYFGEQIIKSGLVPATVKTPQAAVAIILTGREIGIGPMTAFQSINVVQGKPTVSPQLMIALAERTGQLTDYTIEDDGHTATVTVTRSNRTPFSASYSMDDAKAAGLAGKDNWKKQPKVMRQWRAVSAAFRVVFADVLAGLYTPEEMEGNVPNDNQLAETGRDFLYGQADIENEPPETLIPHSDLSTEPAPRTDGQLDTIKNLCQDLVDHYGPEKAGQMVKGILSMIGGPDSNYDRIDDPMTYDDAQTLVKRLTNCVETAIEESNSGGQ